MSGLIFGAALKGLGDAGVSLGGAAMNHVAREEDARGRAALQRELLADKLEAQREIAAMRAGASGSGGSKDGPFIDDVQPGSLAEETMANRMGMSVPELRALRAANASGDASGLGTEVSLPGPTEDGAPLRGRQGVSQDWLKAKRAALADIQSEFLHGKNYDDVAKGRRTEMGNKVGAGIIAGEIGEDEGAKAIASVEGKSSKKESGGTVYDEFSGKGETTAVGKSTIAENNAKASDAASKAKQRDNGQDPERLKLITDLTARERTLRTQMGRLGADPIIANDIKKGRAPQAYVEMQDELEAVLAQRKALQIGNVKEKGDNGPSAPGKKERPPLSNFLKR